MSLETLLEKAASYGVEVDAAIEFAETPDSGLSAYVKPDRVSGPPRIKLTNPFIVKPFDAYSAFGITDTENLENETSIFKLYIASMRNGSIQCEKFQPYIDLLPSLEEIHSPLSMSSKSLYVFSNTSLQGSIISKKLESLKDDFGSVLKYNNRIEFEDYLWAHLIVTSRAFPYKIINVHAKPHLVMLLPVVDLLNHKPNSKVDWRSDANGNFEFVYKQGVDASKAMEDGKVEIFNNYGPKGNAELLMGYGFVIEDNEVDSLQLSLSLDKRLQEEILRDWRVEIPTLDDYTHNVDGSNGKSDSAASMFILNKFSPLPDSLIQLFGYLNRNSLDKQLTLKSLMNGLTQLNQSLHAKFADKLDRMPPFDPTVVTEYDYSNARVFRQGQLKIYNLIKKELKEREKILLKTFRKNFITIKDIYKKDKDFEIFIKLCNWNMDTKLLSKMEMETIITVWLLKTVNSYTLETVDQFYNSSGIDLRWVLELFHVYSKEKATGLDEHEIKVTSALYNDFVPYSSRHPELFQNSHWGVDDWILVRRIILENSYEKGKSLEPLLIKPEDFPVSALLE